LKEKIALIKQKQLKIILLLFFCLIFLCAHQIPPSGGPDDKIPPQILSSIPAIGSLNVPKNASITFLFSEWINPQNIENCITLFPKVEDGIIVKASGKRLIIRPKKKFADSTTYHIGINTSLTDLHGNFLKVPYQYYFSTGSCVDSGNIFGCVILNDFKGIQPKIVLFKSGQNYDTVYFSAPMYITQTDTDGFFKLQNIREGNYDILGFIDANNNNKIDPLNEQVFSSFKRSIFVTNKATSLELYPIVCDTTSRKITSVRPISKNCLMCEFFGASSLPDSFYDNFWAIENKETKNKIKIERYIPIKNKKSFFLLLSDTLNAITYNIIYKKISPLNYSKENKISYDTLSFNGIITKDSTSPLSTGFFPKEAVALRPKLKIFWSKPVISTFTEWYCNDTLNNKIKIEVSKGFCDTTYIFFEKSLLTNMRYSINFKDSMFKDICENFSKNFKIEFKTISEKDLCFSISGAKGCFLPNEKRIWEFIPFNRPDIFLSKDKSGLFYFDSIPKAKGRIGYFIDLNDNNKPDLGSLFPFNPPEEHIIFKDTIEARARWDVEDIPVTCEKCKIKR
jgi:hypothetical protein